MAWVSHEGVVSGRVELAGSRRNQRGFVESCGDGVKQPVVFPPSLANRKDVFHIGSDKGKICSRDSPRLYP